MLNVTKLWCGAPTPGDALRYGAPHNGGRPEPRHLPHHRPIVVWNLTRTCNLSCAHCYISAIHADDPSELTTNAAFGVVDQLAQYGVPVVLLSGGEPLVRRDLMDIARYAVSHGLRVGVSTNGTLITQEVARQLKEAGVYYVGISIDGPQAVNDKFRGSTGAYDRALQGVRCARALGLRVSLRFTLTAYNHRYLGEVFDLVEQERIPRVCIYHLAYAGRGAQIRARASLSHQETRQAVDICLKRADAFHRQGLAVEVLTVDNHTDAAYLMLRVAADQPHRTREVAALLKANGGNSSGVGIASIGPRGDVHADQFSHHRSFGNVRDTPFGQIWEQALDPTLAGLKARPRPLEGRCSTCPVLPICNGNLRVRAETHSGNVWAADPACYLSDRELQKVGEDMADD